MTTRPDVKCLDGTTRPFDYAEQYYGITIEPAEENPSGAPFVQAYRVIFW